MNEIHDDRIKPYFIKIVNANYEVHRTHTPKDADKQSYTKFVCSKDNIRSALTRIAALKLESKRVTKKTIQLKEYLEELSAQQVIVEELLNDDAPEKKIKNLEKRIKILEDKLGKGSLVWMNDKALSDIKPVENFELKIT